MVSSLCPAPSILTISAPARRNRVDASSARSGVASAWNGRSATSKACFSTRATAAVWYSMSSTVTGKVESCPCTTMPSESPISTKSMPLASSTRAKPAS
jgi:hypothetical protein